MRIGGKRKYKFDKFTDQTWLLPLYSRPCVEKILIGVRHIFNGDSVANYRARTCRSCNYHVSEHQDNFLDRSLACSNGQAFFPQLSKWQELFSFFCMSIDSPGVIRRISPYNSRLPVGLTNLKRAFHLSPESGFLLRIFPVSCMIADRIYAWHDTFIFSSPGRSDCTIVGFIALTIWIMATGSLLVMSLGTPVLSVRFFTPDIISWILLSPGISLSTAEYWDLNASIWTTG